MARIGINYQDVAEAAATVQGHNEIPTVDRVREILKTGSKSTIARHLKDWKTRTEQISNCQGIPQELNALIKGLWDRLQQEAESKISHYQQEADKDILAAQQIYIEEQKQHLQLQNLKRELEEKIHLQTNTINNLQTLLEEEKLNTAKLTERENALSQQLNNQKSESQRLHQLLAHVQANLEHYQLSMQKLREEQSLAAETQRINHEREMNLLKQNLSGVTHQFNELNREQGKTITELKLLTQQSNSLLEDKNNLQKQLQEKIINETILQDRCKQLSDTSVEYKKIIEKNAEMINESEKKIAVFIEQLSQLNISLSEAQDNIRILRDEKLFLAQEKAHLEGQFKQLQS